MFECLVARLECELGSHADAGAKLSILVEDDCAAIRRDLNWMLAIGLLSDVAVRLDDTESATTLYRLLAPYASLIVGTPHAFHTGVASRYLGVLASALSRHDEAIGHLEHAVAAHEKLGARPWAAHARADHGRALLARDAPGDHHRAHDLLRDALATYEALGMTASAHRASASLHARAGSRPA
jgi:tetratricopeptide (TPR) repeat protein